MERVVYQCPNLEPFSLSDEKDNDGLTYWKELIYEGDFVKTHASGRKQPIPVDKERLNHWHNTINAMLSNGVAIPLPKGHTTDPELKRGSIVGSARRRNKAGKESLFAKVKFKDSKSADDLKGSDVSIFADNEFTDGKDKYYFNPITHVAVTDYPVINGLEGFEAIVASFDTGDEKMALRKIADKLGLGKDIADDALEGEIDKAIDALNAAVEKAKGGEKPADPPAPKKDEPAAVAASHSPVLLGLFAENRQTKIDTLLRDGKITPAVAGKLSDSFTKQDTIKLSLSNDGKCNDGFDATISALALQEPVKRGEQTGAQTIVELSNADLLTEKNPLLADTQARVKAAAGK